MADELRPALEDLARQARRHLESLRSAGVDWLPRAPALADLLQQPSPSALRESGTPVSLFGNCPTPAADGETSAAAALSPEQRRQGLKVLTERVSPCAR